jgi:pimeloyl-ACP methyl ester carboxylesterase
MDIHVNGFTMYVEAGGVGAPLVYVHGGNTSLVHALRYGHRPFAWRWRRDFVDRFSFVWYERRGCYRSSAPDRDYELETQASDLVSLLDHLGIERAHLVGMSSGGPIAVLFAAMRPRRVRSLALVSTGLSLWSRDDPKTGFVTEQRDILRREGAEAVFARRPVDAAVSLDALWERDEPMSPDQRATWEEGQRALAREAETIPHAERVRRYAAELLDITAGMDVDLRTYAEAVAAPTLIVHGSADRIVPLPEARALAANISGSELRIVADGGHQMLFTDAEVRKAIIAFAHRHDSGEPRG